MIGDRRGHGVSVPANAFLALIATAAAADTPHLEMADFEVAGEIDLSGRWFPKGLRLERVFFRDLVRMRNTTFMGEFILTDCEFNAPLEMENAKLKAGMGVRNCRFGLNGVDLTVRAIMLDGASVLGEVQFCETEINGRLSARRLVATDISFRGCTIEGELVERSAVVDLSAARILGTVSFERGGTMEARSPLEALQEQSGALTARRSTYSDARRREVLSLRYADVIVINLSVARFSGNVDCHFLECRVFNSDVNFYAPRANESVATWRGGVAATCFGGAEIDGDLLLSGGNFGLIRLLGIGISGSVKLFSGTSGQIDIEDGHHGGGMNIAVVCSRIGSFFMSSWHCRDYVRLHPSHVTGKDDERGLTGVHISSSQVDRTLSLWPGQSACNRLQNHVDTSTEYLERAIHWYDWDLREWREGERSQLDRWSRSLSVSGRVSIKHCTIGEDLVMTGITVKPPSDGDPGGGIEVLRCDVKGNVRFDTPATYLADSEHDNAIMLLLAQFHVALRSCAVQSDAPAPSLHPIPMCDYVDFSDLKAEKIELSGLRLGYRQLATHSAPSSGPRPSELPDRAELSRRSAMDQAGGVNLQSSEIGRRLATFTRLSRGQVASAMEAVSEVIEAGLVRAASDGSAASHPQNDLQFPPDLVASRPEEANFNFNVLLDCFGKEAVFVLAGNLAVPARELSDSALIPGALKLEHASIDKLRVSDDSFCTRGADDHPERNGIVLAFANVNRLYVARRRLAPHEVGKHNGFPVPVNLLNCEVRSWFLESEKDPPREVDAAYIETEAIDSDPYLDLLDNDPYFHMSSYLAVERLLRDRGLDREATHIYIAGVYRDTRTRSDDPIPRAKAAPPAALGFLAKVEELSKRRPSWWNKTLVWRPGDGRYKRPSPRTSKRIKAVFAALVDLCILLIAFRTSLGWAAAAGLIGVITTSIFASNLFATNLPLLRLVRPPFEYLSFVICVALIVAGLAIFVLVPWGYPWPVLGFIVYMIAGYLMFQTPVRVFVDYLFWSLIGYGTSTARLALVIGVLMLASYVFATDARNFEPTLAEQAVRTQHDVLARLAPMAASPLGQVTLPALDDVKQNPTETQWPMGERIWAMLRYHVPLVNEVISEEWQPSVKPMTLTFISPPNGAKPGWWPFAFWPRARDWFATMLWLNWVLWPLFLPFLIRILTRRSGSIMRDS